MLFFNLVFIIIFIILIIRYLKEYALLIIMKIEVYKPSNNGLKMNICKKNIRVERYNLLCFGQRKLGNGEIR